MSNKLSIEQLESDKQYITFKRDKGLIRFNKAINEFKSFKRLDDAYNSLVRIQKQWLLMDDALVIYRLTRP